MRKINFRINRLQVRYIHLFIFHMHVLIIQYRIGHWETGRQPGCETCNIDNQASITETKHSLRVQHYIFMEELRNKRGKTEQK